MEAIGSLRNIWNMTGYRILNILDVTHVKFMKSVAAPFILCVTFNEDIGSRPCQMVTGPLILRKLRHHGLTIKMACSKKVPKNFETQTNIMNLGDSDI